MCVGLGTEEENPKQHNHTFSITQHLAIIKQTIVSFQSLSNYTLVTHSPLPSICCVKNYNPKRAYSKDSTIKQPVVQEHENLSFPSGMTSGEGLHWHWP